MIRVSAKMRARRAGEIDMLNPIFFGVRPAITKAARAAVTPNLKTIVVVGVIVIVMLGVAVYLFSIKQPTSGATVLGLAGTFLGWVVGRAATERAALTS